jgi:glycosyltransferase involved in cell wall biosynthesis
MTNAVSVVIPSYNRAALIGDTVRSVLDQTVKPLEVIIVDDGSTDETRQLCESMTAPVRYVWQENKGLPAARNTGIRTARGDWIALCDSDDVWDRRKLELQVAATMGVGADWSVTGFGLISAHGIRIPVGDLGFECTFPIFGERGVTAPEHFARWLEHRRLEVQGTPISVFAGDAFSMLFDGNVALPSTALISRETFERVGPFDETFRWAEDTEFFHRAASATRAAFVMHPLADYRIGHGSMISAADTSPFIRYAIKSVDQAARLRAKLTPEEAHAYYEGRMRLQARLAHNRLSVLDREGVREAIREGWRHGRVWSARAMLLLSVSLLPIIMLRGLHSAKRKLRG